MAQPDIPAASATAGPPASAGFLRRNIRQYGILFALVVIMIFFQVVTDGTLFRPVNLTNLALQNSHIVIMAVGMLLVIVSGHIDLSVGSVAAFVGAVVALLIVEMDLNFALAALIGAAEARGMAFISDEIYHGIQYGARAVSALEVSDEVYVINSFSKYFSMTGWRIGWMVVPEAHVRRVERLAQNFFICPPHASQVAALAALDAGPELEANVDVYRANRALMLEGLPAAGFTRFAPPDGAFYIYADVSEMTDDSRALAARILREAGVAVTPGLDFDTGRGHGTLRFSYAAATAEIAEGLRRLRAWAAAQPR